MDAVSVNGFNNIQPRTKLFVFGYINRVQMKLNKHHNLFAHIPKQVPLLILSFYYHDLNQNKKSLQNQLKNRPTKQYVANLGYVDDSGMANALQLMASNLNRRLTFRKSRG
eukprot:211591_1